MKLSWIVLSLISLSSFSVMITLITYLSRKGLSVPFILFAITLVVSAFYAIQLALTNQFKPHLDLPMVVLLLVASVLSYVGNLAMFQATNDSPNPGLVAAIVGMESGIIAILAYFLLKDKLNFMQLLGLGVGIIAIILISFGSSSADKGVQSRRSEVPGELVR